MVGYTESLTDPSYAGQILVLTQPLIGNYGIPDQNELDEFKLLKYFESNKIHLAGLVVNCYSKEYSHYLAKSSLGEWLISMDIPAICSVDTRAITKNIRNNGSNLAKLLIKNQTTLPLENITKDSYTRHFINCELINTNNINLVGLVSCKSPTLYTPPDVKHMNIQNKPIRILAVDLGLKYNQIRCLLKRGVEVLVVPFDYDFIKNSDFDGLFLSNGPGN